MEQKATGAERVPALIDFLNGMVKKNQVEFAKKCGTTIGQLRQIGHGKRPCNAATAVEVDRHSKGAVPLTELNKAVDWGYAAKVFKARKAKAKAGAKAD